MIAFFILMHDKPEQAVRLIERLESLQSKFFVHVDRRAAPTVYSYLDTWASKRDHVCLVKRHPCYWGGFGIVSATLECMRTALRSNESFDCAILLSGRDYPIKPTSYIHGFVNARQQFIESFRLDKENRWTNDGGAHQSMRRISWYHLQGGYIPSRKFFPGWLQSYMGSGWLHIPAQRRLPVGLHPYGGSQWWCLSRQCLGYIDEFTRKNPAILRYFRHVFVPDEIFFQTIISNSPFRRDQVSDDLHYIDWTRPNPHIPRTFDADDFESIGLSAKLFARKFDLDRDSRILDLIDREIM